MSDELWTFDAQMLRVAMEADRTRKDLDSTARYLRSRHIAVNRSGGWRQFLEEEGPPTATATACIAQSVVMMEARHDYQLDAAREFLIGRVQPEGAWTKPELDGCICLTLTTCLVLGALASLGGGDSQDVIARATAWLCKGQNADGGWGNLPSDGRSDVTCSAYAVRALSRVGLERHGIQTTLQAGAEWLHRQCHRDGGWGVRAGRPATLAHTSHAVEALLALGHDPAKLAQSREWLLHAVINRPNPWQEHYNFSEDYPRDLPLHSRLTWTHLPAERSLIALLKLGLDPLDDIVHSLVADIRARHFEGRYWEVPTVPDAAPSWGILEATGGLVLYADRLAKSGQLGVIRTVCRELTDNIAEVAAANSQAAARIEALTARVASLEHSLDRANSRSGRAARLFGIRQRDGQA